MFANAHGEEPPTRRRGLSAFTANTEPQYAAPLVERLRLHNLNLIAQGAHHRWVARDGKSESVTVEHPVFSDPDKAGCRKVIAWRPARDARCNGDGTVSFAWERR